MFDNTAGYTDSRFQQFGRKLDEEFTNAAPRVNLEAKKIIACLNDEIVPQVRRSSSQALRTAAGQLCRLAEHLERR